MKIKWLCKRLGSSQISERVSREKLEKGGLEKLADEETTGEDDWTEEW